MSSPRVYAGGWTKLNDGKPKQLEAGNRIVTQTGSLLYGFVARVAPDGETRQQRRAIARGDA